MSAPSARPEPGTVESLALLTRELGYPDPADQNRWRRTFWEFHRANPFVYKLMHQLCADLRAHNPSAVVGIDLLVNRLRWEFFFSTESGDGFKLNQNHAAYYARMLVVANPDWDGLFEFRALGPQRRS